MGAKPDYSERRDSEHEGVTAFAGRLKTLRVLRGFRTARSFARALDIDENRYTRWERGEVEPSVAMLSKMAEILNLPVDILVSGADFSQVISASVPVRDVSHRAPMVSEEPAPGRGGLQEPRVPFSVDRSPEEMNQKLLLASRAHLMSLVEQRIMAMSQVEVDTLIRVLTSLPAGVSLGVLGLSLSQADDKSPRSQQATG
jgi:transcriptional regulator with XRE-family HTH domain